VTAPAGRDADVDVILESVVRVGRELRAARRSPFENRRLTPSQLDALFLVAHAAAPVSPGALAGWLGITPGAVTQLVDGLCELDLIDRSRSAQDARVRVLQLTEHARTSVADFESETVARLRPVFDPLTDQELATIAGLLARLETP
jgi:DNA-binding MarR family transcriptional regulator